METPGVDLGVSFSKVDPRIESASKNYFYPVILGSNGALLKKSIFPKKITKSADSLRVKKNTAIFGKAPEISAEKNTGKGLPQKKRVERYFFQSTVANSAVPPPRKISKWGMAIGEPRKLMGRHHN